MAGRLLFGEPKLLPIFDQHKRQLQSLINGVQRHLQQFGDDRKDFTEVEPLTWLLEAECSLQLAMRQIGFGIELCVEQGGEGDAPDTGN